MTALSTTPSYASVTTTTVSSASNTKGYNNQKMITTSATNGAINGQHQPKTSFECQLEELSKPEPQSMTLIATLQLLAPLGTKTDVFLLSRSYLQNWLIWAYHQKVAKTESSRVEAAVRMASECMDLPLPHAEMAYDDPGPIDSSILSIEGHPLLLRPNVEVNDPSINQRRDVPYAIRQVKSLPDKDQDLVDPAERDVSSSDQENTVRCCAVPQSFYETLRSTHGVVCDDGMSISFQPSPIESDSLLHHHPYAPPAGSVQVNGCHHNIETAYRTPQPRSPLKPIEFRRRVILKPAPTMEIQSFDNDPTSPMSKLLREEHKRSQPKMVPAVELHPLKLKYTVIDGKNLKTRHGFVLVSRRARIHDALQSLLSIAAPHTSSSCKRLWSKRESGTPRSGDGHEIVEVGALDGKLIRKDMASHAASEMLAGEWARSFGNDDVVKEIDMIVETVRPTEEWPRNTLELWNRIQVGDFVDAQDAAGKWYEAIVQKVTDDTVTVHYFGWASKWNATIRRRKDSEINEISGIFSVSARKVISSHTTIVLLDGMPGV